MPNKINYTNISVIIIGIVFFLLLFLGGKTYTPQTSVAPVATATGLDTPAIATPVAIHTTISSLSTTLTTPTNIYKIGLVSKSFSYVLRGNSGIINVNLYSEVNDHISSGQEPMACKRYSNDPSPCTNEELRIYYLKYLDEPNQQNDLTSLVNFIKAKTSNRDDQARIAINLVQNIPYDNNKLYSYLTGSTRYPYQVLYENLGVCEEKSLLLAYLLRQLGYGVVLFEFDLENHMAIGIKSPNQYSYTNSGYAFIETTNPSIPTDSRGEYVGVGKLTSTPKIFQICEGISMDSISEEYYDAQNYNELDKMGPILDAYHYNQWITLEQKYGLK